MPFTEMQVLCAFLSLGVVGPLFYGLVRLLVAGVNWLGFMPRSEAIQGLLFFWAFLGAIITFFYVWLAAAGGLHSVLS